MKWIGSNLPKPEMLVYYFAKLLGLAPFYFKNGTFYPARLLDKLYPVIVAAVNLPSMMMHFWTILKLTKQSAVDGISFTALLSLGFVLGLPSFITQITFLIMHNEVVYLMNELCKVSKELKYLGIKQDYRKLIRNYFATTLTVNIIGALMTVFTFYLKRNQLSCFDWIYVIVRDFINLNTIVFFAQILLYIGQCFTFVNKKLHNTFEPEIQDGSAVFVVSSGARKEIEENDDDLTDLQCVRKIEALHLNLCDLLDRTTHLFAMPIIFNSCRIFCELVVLSYWIYTSITNQGGIDWSLICWGLQVMFGLLWMTYASETTSREGNTTRIVLLRMWNKIKSVEVDEEFFMFSLQLLHNPVAVSVFGFLDLGYSFIYKILCAAVTYFIIMIQLATSEPNHDT